MQFSSTSLAVLLHFRFRGCSLAVPVSQFRLRSRRLVAPVSHARFCSFVLHFGFCFSGSVTGFALPAFQLRLSSAGISGFAVAVQQCRFRSSGFPSPASQLQFSSCISAVAVSHFRFCSSSFAPPDFSAPFGGLRDFPDSHSGSPLILRSAPRSPISSAQQPLTG